MKIDLDEFLLTLPVLAFVLVGIGIVFGWLGRQRELAWLRRLRRECSDCGRIYRGEAKRKKGLLCPNCGASHEY